MRSCGAPSMRAISAINLPPGVGVVLTTKGIHVMLLQVREKLVEGEVLACTLVFRNAGAKGRKERVTQDAIYS